MGASKYPTRELEADRFETPHERLEALGNIIEGEEQTKTEVEILEQLTAARQGMDANIQERGGRSR